MTQSELIRLRLKNLQISETPQHSPSAVVTALLALQAQDYYGTLWAIGRRVLGSTEADIVQAIANRSIVRTWPMRGTLHCVAPADLRWMLALMAPKALSSAAGRHRQLELDDATFGRAFAVLEAALADGEPVSRAALMTALETAGIATTGQRGYHILWVAAQSRLICLGPMLDKEQSFVWLDAWLPAIKPLSREESLAELSLRYFASHGPATVKDLGWWSGLNQTEVKTAIALAGNRLQSAAVGDQTYWFASDQQAPKTGPIEAQLLPGFDEYLLGYTDRSAVLEAQHAPAICPGGNGVFYPTIVIEGRVAGTWKRTIKKATVSIDLDYFPETRSRIPESLGVDYARFLGLELKSSPTR